MNETTYAPGRYKAKIKDYGWIEAGTGTPQFYVQFTLLGQYLNDGQLVNCPCFERTFYRAISQKDEKARQTCANMLKADLSAIGVKVDDEAQLDPQQPGAVNLFDQEIDVYLTLEPYQGKTKERWNLRSSSRQKVSVKDLRFKFGGGLFKNDNGPPPPAIPPAADDTPY
jgi:hypothetical protein